MLNKITKLFAWLAAALVGMAGCASVAPLHQGGLRFIPSELRQNPRQLRVLLAMDQKALRISAPGGLSLKDSLSGELVAKLESNDKTILRVDEGHFLLKGESLSAKSLDLEALQPGENIKVGGKYYAGQLSLVAGKRRQLYLINRVDFEDYLCGVLASEVPASWPKEALKTQAIASRTYALFRALHADRPEFDLDDSTRSQVYGGHSHEDGRITNAVRETEGQYLSYQGKPAETFFFSNCGGHTADAADVWGKRVPYLQGVECHFCSHERHAHWMGNISLTVLEARLAKAGLLSGHLEDIRCEDKDASGRWRKVLLKTGEGWSSVKSSAFRNALGADLLRSANFKFEKDGETFHFEGWGWGHGIGLCQEGAKVMAQEGYGFRSILKYYYPGTSLNKIW